MTADSEQIFTLSVTNPGDRLDRYIAAALPELSRAAVQRLLEAGEITVNGRAERAAYKVRAGDGVTVRIPPPTPVDVMPEALPLTVLYEDADILVLDKAAGMVVHPGAGNPSGTLVNAILAHCPDLAGVGGELRPGIVHRLDKDTSGVMVVAKHDRAIRALQRQFKNRTVDKRYVALVIGRLEPESGLIEAPIDRHRIHRQRMAVAAEGRMARTRWEVQARYRDAARRPYTLVEAQLLTGRTHQIRVHFAWLGFPLLGDALYGPAQPPLVAPRQFLHARALTLAHPGSGEEMLFTAPLPFDLAAVLAGLSAE